MAVNSIEAQALLQQMRALAAQAQGAEATAARPATADFSGVFRDALNRINETQRSAGQLAASFERGDQNTDLAEVMVALQKANVSFEAAVQVRNRLVSAYQEIMNMPI
ncbi:MAG: flagellar hook-basal body complex protein FliE [Pseudomonadota bacterium]